MAHLTIYLEFWIRNIHYVLCTCSLLHRLEKNKRLESTDWYATGDSRESVRVDTAGNGLARLWQQQICQFPAVTLDIAQAIVSNYSSPLVLINVSQILFLNNSGSFFLRQN